MESLLGDAQEKLIHQNQKFEAQLQAVRDRLEQARNQKTNQSAMSSINFGRIAKPLRGGGNVVHVEPSSADADNSKREKRSSWMPGFMNSSRQ